MELAPPAESTDSMALNASRAPGLTSEEFDAAVRRCQGPVYRVVRALVRDADAADTLTQECFLRAFRGSGSFRGESSVDTWLFSIAVNLARDHLRSRRWAFWRRVVRGGSFSPEEAVLVDRGADPERALAAREEVASVWAAVEELSPQQKAVFVLRFAEEQPLEEIARVMGLTPGTVKAHLHRATSAVRQRLCGRRT